MAGGPCPIGIITQIGCPRSGFSDLGGFPVLPPPSCPMGLDLNGPFNPRRVMPKARPCPILWLLNQAALDWIPMHILQFLDALLFREDIEILITSLPERAFVTPQSNREFDRFDRPIKAGARRFVHQKMNVLRHHHITRDNEFILLPDSLQRVFKEIPGFGRGEIRETPITTEGEEVHIPAVLVTNKPLRHGKKDTPALPPRSENPDLGHPVFSSFHLDGNLRHPPTEIQQGERGDLALQPKRKTALEASVRRGADPRCKTRSGIQTRGFLPISHETKPPLTLHKPQSERGPDQPIP
jgi:hypothetical protein